MSEDAASDVLNKNFVWNSERWNGFELRDDDIVISTAPKCGTTWMQMQCALLLFRTPDLPAPLAKLSPWLDMNTRPIDDVLADLDAETHRRFIKTHTALYDLPWDDRVTYLHVGRDPRDAARSWDNHMANMDFERMKARSDELVPNSDTPFWRSSSQFFDQARSGDWRDLMGDGGLARYEAAVRVTTDDDDLIAWLHAGTLG